MGGMRTPDSWHTARATVAIAFVTGFTWLAAGIFRVEQWAVLMGAFVPADVTGDLGFTRLPWVVTPLTATLLHAGIGHLFFNLLIFMFCGRAVEGAVGPRNLLILYVAGAFVAAAAEFTIDPDAAIPMIGASGAVSAIIGASAMLFGKNRVRVANGDLALWLNALWLLVAWVIIQAAVGLVFGQQGLMLAVGAHVGGFVAGLLLARPLLLWRYRSA